MEETMKKIIMFLMAATMIIGFSGISMAADLCTTCAPDGTINRACPEEQDNCESLPFDYEDVGYFRDHVGDTVANYCDEALVKKDRRVIFPACDCDNFEKNDTIDIRLEILVNGVTGDNGAYWAENVGSTDTGGNLGIDVGTYSTSTAACAYDRKYNYNGRFQGAFDYMYYDDEGDLVSGGKPRPSLPGPYDVGCYNSNPKEDRANRVVVIQPAAEFINNRCLPHGYVITEDDDVSNKAMWAINIPWIRFDLNKVQIGDEISVKICVAKAAARNANSTPPAAICTIPLVDLGGICGDTGCCCEFKLGTLGCCGPDNSRHLIYPYATPMNSTDWWYGFVITNTSDEDGEAEVTVYEADGDTTTVTVTVAANNMYVANNQTLMTLFGGAIGDAKAYFDVSTDFPADGFMYIGNDVKGEAMGYLPTKLR
jgi:hypothetical protein